MAFYKRIEQPPGTLIGYRRETDGAQIPLVDGNADYEAVKTWLTSGNTADPADPPVPLVSEEIEIKPPSVRTVGNQTVEIFRVTIPTRSGYRGVLTLFGINASDGSTRITEITASVGRWDGGAVQFTGSPTVPPDHTAGANPPNQPPAPVVSGNDYVVSVQGTGGRTYDWQLIGTVRRFKPSGF